ncbi:MAG TPA: response regulator [Gemmatimonadales bacterium]|jgi:PAS domain S-box-containing protein
MTSPITVLLVEDNPGDARLVTELLRDATGATCQVESVARLLIALERIAAGGIDLVLLDLGLPDSQGAATFDVLHRAVPEMPVIVLTGLGDEALGLQLIGHGAQDYLVKGTVDGGAMSRAIRYAIERATSERTLRERESQFRELAENIDEVFFVQAADFSRTLYISPAYETIWGRSCQSVYDNPAAFMDAVVPEDRAALAAGIAINKQGRATHNLEFRVQRPDGTIRQVSVRATGIRNEQGVVYRISGVASDITEERRIQDALRDSEALYRQITDTSFDAIERIEDGILREANAGFVRMFGYDSVDEVIGKPVSAFVADESQAEVARRVSQEIEGSYEFVGLRKDGARIQVEATSRTHASGDRRYRLTALRDLTEKRVLEEQFRQAQKMEAIGRLAGGVAHDFNNLLMVITGCGELLLEDLAAGDPRRENADELIKAAEAAAALTRQLLAFSRQQVIQPRVITIESVLQSSEKMLRRLIGEDVALALALNPAPATVKIDPHQLEQVVMNLVVNARDAMPSGGRITIDTTVLDLDDAYVRSHWPATAGMYVMLAVTDTGIGMDESTRARIFEPFFTTKEMGKGTGLGLSMVYGIVRQSGGFIWVYSEPGRGATFKIYLPLVDGSADVVDHVTEIGAAPTGTETILLVEDEEAVRSVVRQALDRHGYKVLVAPDGAAAIGILTASDQPVHLLITDVVMPGLSGRQLAEQFATMRPAARILFMSGYTTDAVVRHGVLDPGIAYLQKPFSPAALLRKVRQVLDGR